MIRRLFNHHNIKSYYFHNNRNTRRKLTTTNAFRLNNNKIYNFNNNNTVLKHNNKNTIKQQQVRSFVAAKKKGGRKKQTLENALLEIEKQFGKGSIMQLGQTELAEQEISVISTGSLGLDLALGCGGLPRGRVVELYGPESSGKTTLALHVIAEAQKMGGQCTFIDAEHALDPQYAKALGVNVDDLFLSQPDSGEQALEIADTLSRTGAMDVVVIDSVAALVPRAELEGEMGDSHMALQARLMSQALRKMTGTLAKSDTLMIFINQIRSKVGVIFGSPEVTAGGNALKFYASVRLDIRKREQIKDGSGANREVVGNATRVKVVKNKMAPPFREVQFDMLYGKGICRTGELIDMGIQCGVLNQSGSWISMAVPDEEGGSLDPLPPFAQGREKAKDVLDNNAELYNEIDSKIKLALKKVEDMNHSSPSNNHDNENDEIKSEVL